jgi:hypothetical protein
MTMAMALVSSARSVEDGGLMTCLYLLSLLSAAAAASYIRQSARRMISPPRRVANFGFDIRVANARPSG